MASDVAARGLDIPSVTTVIHYDVARVVDTFIHRSGRTAVRYIKMLFACRCCGCSVHDIEEFHLGLESLTSSRGSSLDL